MSNAIVYFSYAGDNQWSGESSDRDKSSTEHMAEIVQQAVGGELLSIVPVNPYPSNYQRTAELSKEELANEARPAIASVPDLTDVDTVFLGFPNWWGTMPMVVWTFLESEDMVGKRIAPFCTSEGSGMGRSEEDIRALCPDAVVERGLAVPGADVEKNTERIGYWAHRVLEK